MDASVASSGVGDEAALAPVVSRVFQALDRANTSGTIVEVLRQGCGYVAVDEARSRIEFDPRALFLGFLAFGAVPQRGPLGNTAIWFTTWLAARVGMEAIQRVVDQRADLGAAARALNAKFEIALSPVVLGFQEPASAYALATVKRPLFDARHLFAAMLDRGVVADMMMGLFKAMMTERDLEALKRDLVSRIMGSPEGGETEEAWFKALGLEWRSKRGSQRPAVKKRAGSANPPSSPELDPTPAARADDAVSPFNGDTPSAHDVDVLDTKRDVEALAQLVRLDGVTPLAIAIFGDWGSGKSTFMDRLEKAVREAPGREAGQVLPLVDEASAARFVHPIVQIRFNAWHFADANLWASLTAEFFDQLRAGGHDDATRLRHAQLVQRVNQHVHALSDTLSANRQAMAKNGEAVLEAQKARDLAAEDAREASGKVFAKTAMNLLSESYAAQKGHLAALGLGGAANQDKAASAIVGAAKDASAAFGSLRALWGVLKASGKRWWLTLTPAAFLAGWAVVAIWKPDLKWLDVVAPLLAGGVALAASFGKALGPALAIVRDIAKRGSALVGEIDATNKATVAALVVKEAELNKALAEALALEDAEATSTKALARYVDPLGKANPPRLLRYILEDDPDTKALEKDIGLIGRTRRLFQAVDTIANEVREARRTGGYADKEDADWATPERIIIYIDDLDRCHEDKVYEVLQAIHLLLAFDLFVVVVGVDVKWVEAALAKQFEADRREDDTADEERRKAAEDARKARAMAYLEKIFQIPFWLRPLSSGKGGTFQPYIEMLAGESVEKTREKHEIAARAQVASSSANITVNLKIGDMVGGEGPGDEHRGGEASSEGATTVTTDGAARDEGGAKLVEARRKLQLTDVEIAFLGSPEIAALAATAPRGVKRLVNVYRIARARRGQEDGEAVLGGGGRRPEYPLIALMAVIETGQRPVVADWFYERLKSGQPGSVESLISPYAKSSPDKPETAEVAALYAACVAATKQRKAGFSADDLLVSARLVRRYSFNRYH